MSLTLDPFNSERKWVDYEKSYRLYRRCAKNRSKRNVNLLFESLLPLMVPLCRTHDSRCRWDRNRLDELVSFISASFYRHLTNGRYHSEITTPEEYKSYVWRLGRYMFLDAYSRYCKGAISILEGDLWEDFRSPYSTDGTIPELIDRMYIEELPRVMARKISIRALKRGGDRLRKAAVYVFRRFMKNKPVSHMVIRDQFGMDPQFVEDWTIYSIRSELWYARSRHPMVPTYRSNEYFYVRS